MNNLPLKTGMMALLLAALAIGNLGAQPLTLQECLAYGKTHNIAVQRSAVEIARNEGRVTEGIAGYLPQVNATGTWNNNLQLPTQIIPGAIFGQPGQNIAVQFGTKYNVSGSVDVSQVIYNQSLLTGIKAAKASRELATLGVKSAEEEMVYNIAAAYYNAQISATQRTLLQANLTKVDTLIGMTKIKLDRGFAKKTDYDRLVVNQTNLQTELQNLGIREQQQLVLLKYHMGMSLDSTIAVPNVSTATAATMPAADTNMAGGTIDMQLLDSRIGLTQLNLEQIHAGYYPSLSLQFRASYQAQQNDFNVFGSNSKWFPTSLVGLTLNVPLFDGLNKMARAQQVEADLMQLDLDRQNLERQIRMRTINATNSMNITTASVATQQRNMELADEVYRTTQSQFQGGIVPLSDLLNAETALREAQTNYVRAVLDTRIAELDVLRSAGTLTTIAQ